MCDRHALYILHVYSASQYPLPDRVKEEAADGREKGVGVIVSINKNRNDAWKLPDDILDLAEIEVTVLIFDLAPFPPNVSISLWGTRCMKL